MVINDFYYDFFDSSGLDRNPLDEFLFSLLYTITEDYDSLNSKKTELKTYLDELKLNHNSLWFDFDYVQFGFTSKDFRIQINFGLNKIRINNLSVRPVFFKDPLDYFYLVKLCFSVKDCVEIISDNYNYVYRIRILDRVYVDGFNYDYHCSLVDKKVKIVTDVYFDIYQVPYLLENLNEFKPSEKFYKTVFDCLVSEMYLMNYKTYLNGLCFTILYKECKELYPNFNVDDYGEFLVRALEVKKLLYGV